MISEIAQRQRVMVINNNQDMQHLLNRSLELEGYDTIIVADDDQALELLDKVNPDMVIMDTGAPDEHSLKTLDSLRLHSNVPVIVLSTDNEIETLKKAFAHGADDFVHKPFSTRVFLARVRAKLRRSHTFYPDLYLYE